MDLGNSRAFSLLDKSISTQFKINSKPRISLFSSFLKSASNSLTHTYLLSNERKHQSDFLPIHIHIFMYIWTVAAHLRKRLQRNTIQKSISPSHFFIFFYFNLILIRSKPLNYNIWNLLNFILYGRRSSIESLVTTVENFFSNESCTQNAQNCLKYVLIYFKENR